MRSAIAAGIKPALRTRHLLPVGILALLTLLMLRRWLFSHDLPGGVDSPFLYAGLPFYRREGGAFSVWLPASLGDVQQYSVYWLLALASTVIPNPVTLYRVAALVTVLIAATGTYGLAYWLSRSRLGSAVAGGLYTFSAFPLSIWLGGHLNVGLSHALGPWTIWALWAALRTGRASAMLGLGLSGSALFLLTTGQGAYWLVPMTVIATAELVYPRPGATRLAALKRIARTSLLSLPVFVTASSVALLPIAAAVTAPFLQGSQKYAIESLVFHEKYSLPVLDAVAGIPGNVNLAPGLKIAAWSSDSLSLRFFAFFLVFLALGALLTRHLRTALTLLVPTAIAWFLAAGPAGPIGPFYVWLHEHLRYFSLLRAPSRWLMTSVLTTSLLMALAIEAGQAIRVTGRHRPRSRLRSAATPPSTTYADLGTGIAVVAILLGFLTSTYSVFRGLPTWRPPSNYVGPYTSLRSFPGDWRILTTPFYQEWMESGAQYGSEVAFLTDLGRMSSMWHGRSPLGRGGWDPRAARFVRYLYELAEDGRNHSVSKLLGAIGVKYLGLNSHRAVEVVAGQNEFFEKQRALRLVTANNDVRIYENGFYLPQAFHTRETCIVAGGLGVLGRLAEHSSFDFGRVGIQFADQIFAIGGAEALREALRFSSCLILADAGEDALKVLLTAAEIRSLDALAPIALHRGPASPSRDIEADPSTLVELAEGTSIEGTLRAPRAQRYSLWLSALHARDGGSVLVTIDGRSAGSVDLSGGEPRGRWAASEPVALPAGPHRFSLAYTSGGGARSALVGRVALVGEAPGVSPPAPLEHLRVVREIVSDLPPGLDSALLRTYAPLIDQPWEVVPNGEEAAVTSPAAIEVRNLPPGRPSLVVARARVSPSADLSKPYAFKFKGANTRQVFLLSFHFRDGRPPASFSFRDTSSSEKILLIRPSSLPDRLREAKGFSLEQITLSTNYTKEGWSNPVALDGPYQLPNGEIGPWVSILEDGRVGDPFGDAPPQEGPDGPGVLSPPDQLVGREVRLASPLARGLLVFSQTYHPGWELRASRSDAIHTIALGFANAYFLKDPLEKAVIEFRPARMGVAGTYASLAFWGAVLASMTATVARGGLQRRRGSSKTLGASSGGDGPRPGEDRAVPEAKPPSLNRAVPKPDGSWKFSGVQTGGWAREYFKQDGTVAEWWDPLSPEDSHFRSRYESQMNDFVTICKPAQKLVLDAATGRGRAAIELVRAGASKVVAVDISREMLGLARENARASRSDSAIGFMMGDLVRLPVRSDTFDVALLLETLLHLPAPMSALRELHRAIRPEGFAIVTTNGANPISRLTHPPTRGRHAAPPWKLALATAVNETMTALWGFCWSKSPITARLYKRFFDAPVRPLYPWQVRRMLKAAGFSTVYHSPWPSRLLPWEHRWLAIK